MNHREARRNCSPAPTPLPRMKVRTPPKSTCNNLIYTEFWYWIYRCNNYPSVRSDGFAYFGTNVPTSVYMYICNEAHGSPQLERDQKLSILANLLDFSVSAVRRAVTTPNKRGKLNWDGLLRQQKSSFDTVTRDRPPGGYFRCSVRDECSQGTAKTWTHQDRVNSRDFALITTAGNARCQPVALYLIIADRETQFSNNANNNMMVVRRYCIDFVYPPPQIYLRTRAKISINVIY